MPSLFILECEFMNLVRLNQSQNSTLRMQQSARRSPSLARIQSSARARPPIYQIADQSRCRNESVMQILLDLSIQWQRERDRELPLLSSSALIWLGLALHRNGSYTYYPRPQETRKSHAAHLLLGYISGGIPS